MHTAILRSLASDRAFTCDEKLGFPGPPGTPIDPRHLVCAAWNAGDAGLIPATAPRSKPPGGSGPEVGHPVGAHAVGEREPPRSAGAWRGRARARRARAGRGGRPSDGLGAELAVLDAGVVGRPPLPRSGRQSFPRIPPPGSRSRGLRGRACALAVSESPAVNGCWLAPGLLSGRSIGSTRRAVSARFPLLVPGSGPCAAAGKPP